MAYPAHALVQFGGTLGTAQEIWSCGIRLKSQTPLPGDDIDWEQYLDDNAVPALSAWMVRPESQVSFGVTLDWVKANAIDSAGHYAGGETHERIITPVQGNGGSSILPFQACVVLTWRTSEVARGPGSKGRIYSPLPSLTSSAGTGLFSAAAAADMCESAANLLDGLDAASGLFGVGQVRPAIVSKVGSGHANVIDQVTVDNRIDIQRRRANAIRGVQSAFDVNYG